MEKSFWEKMQAIDRRIIFLFMAAAVIIPLLLPVKPGKGKAFVRTQLRNLNTGAVVDRTFRAAHGQVAAVIRDLQRGSSAQDAARARERLLALEERAREAETTAAPSVLSSTSLVRGRRRFTSQPAGATPRI